MLLVAKNKTITDLQDRFQKRSSVCSGNLYTFFPEVRKCFAST